MIGPNIYYLNLGLANAYLIEGQNGLALVDAGGQGALKGLEARLRSSRFRLMDISHILVTHGHFDHVGGLAEVQAATGAAVWAHRLDAPVIRGEAPVVRPDPRTLKRFDRWAGRLIKGPQPPAPAHRELEAGDVLSDLHANLEVIHLPGHSAGQVGFWFPRVRLLLGGDVLTHFVPRRLTLPLASYTADMAEAERSVHKVARLGVATLGLGHGAPLIKNAHDRIKSVAERLMKRREQELNPFTG